MDLQLDGLSKATILDEDKVNNGVWIALDSVETDSETGHKLPMLLGGQADRPQRALVRSYRCAVLKAAEAQRQKDGFVRMRVAKKKQRDEVIVDSSIMPDDLRFSFLLVALDNFSAAGGVQYVSEADARSMHKMTALSDIVGQINEAAHTDELYLATAETEAGKPSPSSLKATAEKTPDLVS